MTTFQNCISNRHFCVTSTYNMIAINIASPGPTPPCHPSQYQNLILLPFLPQNTSPPHTFFSLLFWRTFPPSFPLPPNTGNLKETPLSHHKYPIFLSVLGNHEDKNRELVIKPASYFLHREVELERSESIKITNKQASHLT